MRFLLCADNFSRGSGGAPRSAQELVRALAAAGHEVTVLESSRISEKADWNGTPLERVRLHGPLLPKDRDLRTLVLNPRWRARVAGLIAGFRPQLLITQGMLAPGALEAARAARIPAAYFFRGYAPFCPHQYQGLDPEKDCRRHDCWGCLTLARKLKYPMVRAVLELYERIVPHAELLVANSRYVAGLFERFWEVKPEVVYPAVSLAPADAPENDPDGYLLFIKPQRVKGLDLVLELARLLPDRKFAVAGETRGAAARALSQRPNVQLLGWREDMAAVYRGARLLLGPSLWQEPFGRVFAEAASAGCPSLAFKAGGIPEAVGAGGVLLERPAGAAQWARALKELDDPQRYENLRRAALEHARELAARGGAKRVVGLLETAARRGPAPRPAPPEAGRKLKVIHVISALSVGGAELSLFHLASRLDREKFDAEVICLREEGDLAARFREAGVPVELFKLPSRYGPGGLLGLARLLARKRADIVHTHLRRPNTSGRIAAWLADVPVIIAHERNPGPGKKWRHFLVDRLLARVSSAMIAVSRQTAERNSRLAGIPLERFAVIPNAVDLEEFRPGDRDAARARLGLDAAEFVVGFAGRLHRVKNLDVLLRAVAEAAEAAEAAPALRLLVAGEGPERGGLEALAAELGISERVTFLGERGDLAEVYPAMDALCLVSKSEGCSRVLLEAAACALAPVVTPVGHAPDMLTDDQSGLFVPAGDAPALAKALVRLAGDAGLREKLGRAAREAVSPLGLDGYVRHLERLYLELWDRRRGTSS